MVGSDISWNVVMSRGKSARVGQGLRMPNEHLHGALEQYNLENKFVDSLVVDNNINPW